MRIAALATAVVLGFTGLANAATVVAYESSNSSTGVAAFDTSFGVSGSLLERGPSLLVGAGTTFNSQNWSTSRDKITALATGSFLTWGFTSSVGYDLSTLDIRYDRSGLGPRQIAINAIINGVRHNDIFTDDRVSGGGETHTGIDLSSFTNVTDAVFELVGFDARRPRGAFDIEPITGGGPGIVVTGEPTPPTPPVAPIPTPASLPLILSALALLAVGVKSRRG